MSEKRSTKNSFTFLCGMKIIGTTEAELRLGVSDAKVRALIESGV